jgi:hypothetical protein
MRSLTRLLVLLSLLIPAASGRALAVQPEPPGQSPDGHGLTDAVFVRPLYGVYRHCGGACLKSGALSRYCFAKQSCHLSCATAPPLMKCAAP